LVQNAHTAGSDRARGQLFKTRHTQFTHNENIERHAQAFGHFVGNRHAAAGQAENNYIIPTGVFLELLGK